jgi:hypothetical protein
MGILQSGIIVQTMKGRKRDSSLPLQVLSGANGHRCCPPRCVGPGNLMAGTTARMWFVVTFALALAACGGGAGTGQGPPVISVFTASPTDAVTGHRITLSWTVTGATDLSISGV